MEENEEYVMAGGRLHPRTVINCIPKGEKIGYFFLIYIILVFNLYLN